MLGTWPTATAVKEDMVARVGHYRWVICALLFFATTINYIDRQVLGILASPLQQELGWSESLSLATAAHQGWSANLFTLVSDMFPRRAVGSVVGIGGFAGSTAGMLIATVTGYLLQWTGSYV